MAEIRKDLLRDTWVVIATGRAVRPTDLPVPSQGRAEKVQGFCPFCEGNEGFTPPEIMVNRKPGTEENAPVGRLEQFPINTLHSARKPNLPPKATVFTPS